MINTYEKTFGGTIKRTKDGKEMIRSFKFEPEDVGKYLVICFPYEEHLGYGAILGTRLKINNHIFKENKDNLYGIYQIGWHSNWCEHDKNMDYKVKLTPIGVWEAWCPNRSWYSSDMESIINEHYNLWEETPVFDTVKDALEFAMKKNYEIYK